MIKKLALAIVRWLDSYQGQTQIDISSSWSPHLKREDMVRCIPFFLLHASCLFVFVVGFSWFAVSACFASYFIRMFAITAFYHRFFSHRCFQTSRVIQFIFGFLGAASAQRGPLWWAAHHRWHHKHSDSNSDIHSPKLKGFWWSHMLWFMAERNFRTKSKLVPDWNKYPELVLLDRFDILAPIVYAFFWFGIGEFMRVFAPVFETNGWQCLIWGFFVSTIVLYHATFVINSLCHTWGTQRYQTNDDSRNNFFLAIICLGEGWHNNHHHCKTSVRQGIKWWEIDISFYLLFLMEKLGLVSNLNYGPDNIYTKRLIESKTQ